MYQILSTKETVLDKKQLKDYLSKLAADNVIKEHANVDTYPIPRVLDNFRYINLIYTLLKDHVKLGIPIHPAGEWLLDNCYLIESTVKRIGKELSKSKYKSLPRVVNGSFAGFARIFVLANEIVMNTDGKIEEDDIIEYLQAYQTQKTLTMDEIWNLGIFLEIAIIEKIRGISEKIFSSQLQKYKVENIVERIIENKDRKKLKVDVDLYPFVEYMSYRLKTYGRITNEYLEVLEEQVKRSGMNLSDIINKEHYNIALKKISMQNCIISIKSISRMGILDIFQNVSAVEQILRQDNVYKHMDLETKGRYRSVIEEISKKTHIAEIYIAKKCLSLTENKKSKQAHIGYYLISYGKQEFLSELLNKKVKKLSSDTKSKIYIFMIYFWTVIFTLLVSIKSWVFALILFIPIQNMVTQIIQYILSKKVKPKIIPKLDFHDTGIPEEYTTMCVIPALLKNKEDVEELMQKLESYYWANKSDNIFFTLLGDCTSEKSETNNNDDEIISAGKEYVKRLNEQYGSIFNFIYRKREWNSSERCYMGWERKRGILNQLNEYLITRRNPFLVNTCDNLPKIKYIITLDSDTKLNLNTAEELVGAMAHILNKPDVDKITNTVSSGHALIQPRVGINIMSERRSMFTRIFAGSGGTDLYTNAVSDIYQDNFDEGIYTGKGIYDLDVFHEVLKDVIPENSVLSHDLLEGNYLRCGLATDVVLMDGYPSHYLAYKSRKHRWIRGDVQIVPWLGSTLNALSKYKILDNIARNTNEFWILVALIIVFTSSFFVGTSLMGFLVLSLFIFAIPTILDLIQQLLCAKIEEKQSLIVKRISKLHGTLYRYLIKITILPDIASLEINAIMKSIYRMKFSHNFMLEWVTSDEAERNNKQNLKHYYLSMLVNLCIGIVFLMNTNPVFWILGILWSVAPLLMCALSKDIDDKEKELQEKDKAFLLGEAKKTWQFFKDNVVNGLPSDNYQADREKRISEITSPTNIGLYLMSILSAYDLKFESLQECLNRIEETINTIEGLAKWNGHLYNWYNIKALEPVNPIYVSSVDSGNFVGYLYIIKQFLIENARGNNLAQRVQKIIKDTDFSKLYNEKLGLFHIGYSLYENKLTPSYYDLLATEARQTSLVAIAKRDVPSRHWNNLGRNLTNLGMYKGLVSWGGTAFEYLMPTINIPSYPTTLIDESCRFSILSQRRYGRKLGIPWGISESGYNMKDLKGNYQYKTFGIPWLGLKRGLEEDAVISPYATALALKFYPKEAMENLKMLAKSGSIGKYGFYESIDYKPKKTVIKSFMAHHQGMILAAINNVINNNIFQKRFMENPEMQGIEILLEERMPERVIVTKEKKEKVEKIKYREYNEYIQRKKGINVLANEKYTIIMKDDGSGYSKYEDDVISDNIRIYIKDINSKNIFDTMGDQVEVTFTPSENEVVMQDGNLLINVRVTIVPNLPIEIREINIKNTGNSELMLEVTSYMDIIFSKLEAFYSHPAFNKMFIEYEKIDDGILVTRRVREEKLQKTFVATSLVYDDSDLEYEIDKEKFTLRGNLGIPDSVLNSTQLSNKIGITIHPIVAMRRLISIKPEEKKKVYLVNAAGDNKEEAEENLKQYVKLENLNRILEISNSHIEAETRYLQIKGQDIAIYQKMLEKLLYPTNKYDSNSFEQDFSNPKIWKYGISGDKPIMLVKIKDESDLYLIQEVLKAKEYFETKNIEVDFIVLSEKEFETDNVRILSNIPREDKRVIEARANLVLNSSLGSINIQMKEYMKNDDKKTDDKYSVNDEILEQKSELEGMNLQYYNGYGGFSQDGKEYTFMVNKNKKTPAVWSNVIANEKFGTVVTESLGGYTWYLNSRMNRITEFHNDSFLDIPSESIFLEENGVRWSVTATPIPDNCNYYISYGFGYAKYWHTSKEIEQKLTVFVPTKDSVKLSVLTLKNTSLEKKKIKIIYDLELVLGEKKDRFVNYNFKENLNMIFVKNNLNPNYYVYISSNEKLKMENMKIVVEVEIDSLESKNITFELGAELSEIECVEVGNKYLGNETETLNEVKTFWDNKIKVVEAHTPMTSFNILQNGWLVYQTIASRMMGKTGFYQSGGAIGYRDQLQDAMGMKYIDSNILRNQIILNAKHQFIQGDVEHWWHDDMNLGIRARYSDDLLWLPYAVSEYIEFTGDYTILDETAEYLIGEQLGENEHDRMDYFEKSEEKGSIYEHCMKAINRSLEFENFPKIQGGDWNDGMNSVGEKGKGESVWLGFFLYTILIKFAEYSKYITRFANKETAIALNAEGKSADVKTIESDEKNDDYERMMEIAEKLKKNLNTIGWDGRWYKRATTDDGKVLGSINNKECRIDSIAQSWSVISNAGDNDKKYIAMESLENYLVDKENNLIKLLTPSFENKEFKPGYIASYAPGMRENGGQYTHAAIWASIAEVMLNMPEKAIEMYKIINPIEHGKTEELVQKYKVEPYVVEADIYSVDNFAGRGGWTWYTGSSSWMYTLQVQYILGLKITHGMLQIRPCVPKDWNEFEVKFRWYNAVYSIKYERKEREEGDINLEVDVKLNGEKVEKIKLNKEGSYNVEVNY